MLNLHYKKRKIAKITWDNIGQEKVIKMTLMKRR